MNPKSLEVVIEGTLQARHFAEIGLSRRQLHIWCNKTGFEPSGRDPGRWRNFSPAEVLRLATIRQLKGRTGLAIVDHRDLIEFIGSDGGFLVPVLELWRKGETPALRTDLIASFEVAAGTTVFAGDLVKNSPFWCGLSLRSPRGMMMSAITRGGSFDQRLWAAQLAETREAEIMTREAEIMTREAEIMTHETDAYELERGTTEEEVPQEVHLVEN